MTASLQRVHRSPLAQPHVHHDVFADLDTPDLPPAWNDNRNASGCLADLVLAFNPPERCADLRRAAVLIIRLARKRDLPKWEARGAARRLGQLTGQALPATVRDVWIGLARTKLDEQAKYMITVAANMIVAPAQFHPTRTLLLYLVSEARRARGMSNVVDDIEVRWRIRDWVGKVPVPPHVRQAACAAWMVKQYAFARELVERYVENWLAA